MFEIYADGFKRGVLSERKRILKLIKAKQRLYKKHPAFMGTGSCGLSWLIDVLEDSL